MTELTIKFVSKAASFHAFQDFEVKEQCTLLLDALEKGEKYLSITTGQELVVYMFRALLFSKYKHLQSQVCFTIDGKGVIFDENMRNCSGIYPPSVFDECCDVLLGAT